MADIDLKTETPDTSLPATGFLFGADSQASASPSVYSTQAVATTLLGSTTLSGTTITANAPVVDFAQTWDNAAVTFTGAKLNINDTASNAASLLMDLQRSGTTRFSVSKNGAVNLANADSGNGALLLSGGFWGSIDAFSFALKNNNGSFVLGASSDLLLTRRGAANLRLGAADTTGTTAPTPQFLSAQSWASSTTNNQTGANFTIDGSQGTGTGAGGSIIFRVAPAGGTANGVQNALVSLLTINGGYTNGNARIDIHNGCLLLGGSQNIGFGGNNNITATFAENSATPGFIAAANRIIGWSSTTATNNVYPSADTILARDAANTLALRNAATAQRFNVYNTWSSTTNYEAFKIDWITTANTVLVGTEKGSGGGTARDLAFQTDGTTRLTISATSNLFTFAAGSTLSLGAGSIVRLQYINSADNAISFFNFYDSTGLATFALGATNARMNWGGTTSSFPALKRSTTFLQARLADDSAFAGFASANVQAATAYTVATLPTPATGMIARVTDATAPVIGATVTGGGAAYALVNYNGANWTVIGV